MYFHAAPRKRAAAPLGNSEESIAAIKNRQRLNTFFMRERRKVGAQAPEALETSEEKKNELVTNSTLKKFDENVHDCQNSRYD